MKNILNTLTVVFAYAVIIATSNLIGHMLLKTWNAGLYMITLALACLLAFRHYKGFKQEAIKTKQDDNESSKRKRSESFDYAAINYAAINYAAINYASSTKNISERSILKAFAAGAQWRESHIWEKAEENTPEAGIKVLCGIHYPEGYATYLTCTFSHGLFESPDENYFSPRSKLYKIRWMYIPLVSVQKVDLIGLIDKRGKK